MKAKHLILLALLGLSSLCYADAHSQALLKDARRGDPVAMRKLALSLNNGDAGNKNVHYAYEWMAKAAQAGDVPAIYYMGTMYENGKGVAKSMEKAAEYYTKAAKKDHKPAIKKLEAMELKFSKDWHEYAAREGSVKSMLMLAKAYAVGEAGIGKDEQRALRYYRQAVEADEAKAMKSIRKAPLKKTLVYWVDRAERNHDVEAMKLLGEAYSEGNDLPKDEEKGLEYFVMASAAGDADATRLIEALPLEKTLSVWDKRAQKGDVSACIKLGLAYENGKGVEADTSKAQHYYAKAVSADKAAVVAAMSKEPTAQTRLFWHYMADEEHDTDAMLKLATAYAQGGTLPQDATKSKHYYNLAASGGNAEAVKVVRNWPLEDAEQFLKNEAMGGDIPAAMKLAEAYWTGNGLPQNRENAKRFYRIAAEHNHGPAIEFLHKHDPAYKTAAEQSAELIRGIGKRIEESGLSSSGAVLLSYHDGIAEEVLYSNLDRVPFENLILRMPVYQKVAQDGFFCLVKNTPICIVVPSYIKVRFAEDDVVAGILVRDGEYTYVNRAGGTRTIRKYRLIWGENA